MNFFKINMDNFIGYKSSGDFMISMTGLYTWQAVLLNSLATTLISIPAFIADWIWPDPKAVAILAAVLIADWITGMVRGIKSDAGFQSNLALRIFPKIAVYGIILAGINSGFGATLGTIFYSGITGITLVSLVKNAASIGWIKGEVAEFLKKHVDRHKNDIN